MRIGYGPTTRPAGVSRYSVRAKQRRPRQYRRPAQRSAGMVTWGFPPYVPGQAFVSPHTGVRDMRQTIDIPVAGTEGMGQYQPGGQADYLTSLKSIGDMYESLKPLIDFLGEHPWITVGLAMTAIITGGAIGGYIGAGIRAEQARPKKK